MKNIAKIIMGMIYIYLYICEHNEKYCNDHCKTTQFILVKEN